MGYYTRLTESSFVIKKENLGKAYKDMCELNKHDELKRGSCRSAGKVISYHFAWMDTNYPDTCANAEEILNMLGFETEIRDNGDLFVEYYDSKIGDELVFIKAIAKYSNGEMYWVGEDGYHYKWSVVDGELLEQAGRITYS